MESKAISSIQMESNANSCCPGIYEACQKGCVECLRVFVKTQEINKYYGIYFPLQITAKNGDLTCMRILLENGADPNFAGCHTVLTSLASRDSRRPLECIKLLFEFGVDPNLVAKYDDDESTPLYLATSWNRKEMVQLLP